MLYRRSLIIAFALAIPCTVRAQCPDGSPPPCAPPRRTARVAEARPDANVIAALPFRVTTADSLLGEGFAELLASEFTGEGTPRAVDMGTLLSEWRRAGGGPRTPLPRQRALAVARTLGAGLLVEGSVVGLGRQITITANVVTVPGGAPRGTSARVTVPADSLGAALRDVSVQLIASMGGQARAAENTRYTSSPEAMRDYLRGLALWRRGKLSDAGDAFDRAIALDSSFAQAMFRRYIAERWNVEGRVTTAMVSARAARLSARERTVLEILSGLDVTGRDTPRPSIVRLILRADELAQQMDDSPEVVFWAGDLWFHYGPIVDAVHYMERAHEYFQRALAVDSQSVNLGHVALSSLFLRDLPTLRRVIPAYLESGDPLSWPTAWIAGHMLGDNALLERLRRSVDPLTYPPMLISTMMVPIPAAAQDEMYRLLRGAMPNAAARAQLDLFRVRALLMHQRWRAAAQLQDSLPEPQKIRADHTRLTIALSGEETGIDAAGIASRFASDAGAATGADTAAVNRACMAAIWDAQHGGAVVDPARFRHGAPRCARVLEIQRIPSDGSSASSSALAVADSAFRADVAVGTSGYEAYVLARAWERAGDLRRALSAMRIRTLHLGSGYAPWTFADEGRLAALVADTVGARRAYRAYLDLTADTDAPAAKRELVKAELAKLRD